MINLAYSACALAFLLGSIPYGQLVARVFHGKDLTQLGSGNTGATNVSRVLGFWPAGFVTFLLDLLKGALPVFLVQPIGLGLWASSFMGSMDRIGPELGWWVGLLAVIGHCYSPWLRFKGGKGVATGFGVLLVLSGWAALAGIGAFALTFVKSRMGSLSSLAGLITAAVVHLVLHPVEPYLWIGALIVAVILLRHEKNLDALVESRESTF